MRCCQSATRMAGQMPDEGGSRNREGAVREHYASEGVAERVLTALRVVSGQDVAITPETLAPIDHFHGRGVAATEELAAMLQPRAGDHVLDIGSGIGGPA